MLKTTRLAENLLSSMAKDVEIDSIGGGGDCKN